MPQAGFVKFSDLEQAAPAAPPPQAPPPEARPEGRWFVSPSEQAGGRLPDYDRQDNSLFGLPPELAVVSGLGVGRAVAGATGVMGRTAAGARAAVSQAVPVVKYEVVKHALQSVGVPAEVATALAIGASGAPMRRRTAAPTNAPVEPVAPASPAAPAASSPAVPASSAASSVPESAAARPATRGLSPQMVQNELGIQARRQKVTLTEPQYKAATELVKQGRTPAEAVTEVAKRAPEAPAQATPTVGAQAPAPPVPKAAKRARLTADEADEYLRLTGKGMSHEEATAALMQQRTLAKRLGTPDPESVRRRVAERNTTGRWPR